MWVLVFLHCDCELKSSTKSHDGHRIEKKALLAMLLAEQLLRYEFVNIFLLTHTSRLT